MKKRIIMDENLQQLDEIEKIFESWKKVVVCYKNGKEEIKTPKEATLLLMHLDAEEKINSFRAASK